MSETAPDTKPEHGGSTTTISRNWLAKMSLFIAAFLGLALWGLIDATIVYPNRGAEHAKYMEYKYLESLEASGEILRASIDNPAERLEQFDKERRDSMMQELQALPPESLSRARLQAEVDGLNWLSSLSTIGRAKPTHTVFDSPGARLAELRAELATAEQPKGLSGLDIPTQWLFVVIGGLGGVWMLLTVMRVVKTTYTFDESTHTLTLPSGESFTPAEIKEIDKRKWDKFFVTITLTGGATHKLDLLRFQPLEEWILAMEKLSPNYEPLEEDEKTDGDPSAEDTSETDKA